MRIDLDVAEPLQVRAPFGLVVDGRHDHARVEHRERDRHEVRATGGAHGGESADPRGTDEVTFTCGEDAPVVLAGHGTDASSLTRKRLVEVLDS